MSGRRQRHKTLKIPKRHKRHRRHRRFKKAQKRHKHIIGVCATGERVELRW